MKTVLLTGGAGFIGSHLAEAYLQAGYSLVVMDNLSSGRIENIATIKDHPAFVFVEADIRDAEAVEDIFKTHNPQIVNHHAAQKSVPASVDDPSYDAEINILGFLNLIQVIKNHPIDNFLYISSGGALSKQIMGNEKSMEDDIPQLSSPYAISKYTSEQYLALYAKLYGFDYTVLRYANVYGPRQIPDGECGVIPIFIDNVLENKNSVLFAFPDMPRGCTRDYVYVSDLVDVNLLASRKPVNTVLNIGFGEEVYILDIFELIKKAFNSSTNIDVQGPRLGDVKRSVLNIGRVGELLQWSPKVDLAKGIQRLKEYILG